jgi:hypothetical protein
MFSALFAFYTKQYILCALVLCFSQMQLSELLIWKGIDDNSPKLNQIGTTYGKYLLATHNIAIGLGIILSLYMTGKNIEKKDLIPLILGIIFFLYVILFVYSKQDPKETYPLKKCDDHTECQNSNNRLVWPYNHSWYVFSFILSLFLLIFFTGQSCQSQIYVSIFFTLSFAITTLFFNSHVVGSMWCFSAAILAPILVIGNYYFMNK